ncbi:MAG: ABC transporter ATP-binding protein [Actinomycetota bacterium]
MQTNDNGVTRNGMNRIELEDIHKLYNMGGEDVHALRGVSLEIGKGEFVAIMGPSGSGKTTLMNIIGLLDKPSSGGYYLDGKSVSDIGKAEQAGIRNRKIGFVFQAFNLLPRTTVLDNVLLPAIYGKSDGRRERAMELIERFGLESVAHHRSNQLSGGQIQRVAIARALIMDPAIIIADEPTGNLDSVTSAEIIGVFREINGDGATIVLITHEPEMAAMADRTVMLRDGRIVAPGGIGS